MLSSLCELFCWISESTYFPVETLSVTKSNLHDIILPIKNKLQNRLENQFFSRKVNKTVYENKYFLNETVSIKALIILFYFLLLIIKTAH